MKAYGRSSISDLLGDRIVYRNLVPADGQLPPLDALREQADLPAGVIPRKSELAYGRVIALLLQAAQSRRLPGVPIQRLIYVGDTRMNDGIAFANVARAGGWPGLAFIAAETAEPARVELAERDGQTLYLANRWAALADFEAYGRDRGFPADERTAVVVDLDKTLLGARGRNDQVIDRARVQAVRLTVAELLGDEFDPRGFQAAYDLLNQQAFHPFTADNQDYLAYICLMLGGGLFRLEPLVEEVRAGRMESFAQFIAAVDGRRAELPATPARFASECLWLRPAGRPNPVQGVSLQRVSGHGGSDGLDARHRLGRGAVGRRDCDHPRGAGKGAGVARARGAPLCAVGQAG